MNVSGKTQLSVSSSEIMQFDRFRILEERLPRAQIQQLHDAIAGLEYFVPAWCNHVNVKVTEEVTSDLACIDVDPNYQWATIEVYSGFFAISIREQRETMLHELVHITLAPLTNYGKQALRLLTGESPVDDIVKNVYNDKVEFVCQSLTYLFEKGLPMPYKSKAQQRFMHAKFPKIAKKWDKETKKAGGFKKLPARKRKKK